MPKKSKRTISSLLKSRPKGRFAPKGFDLLGEGDRLVLKEEESNKNPVEASSKTTKTNSFDSLDVPPSLYGAKPLPFSDDAFIGNPAIAKSASEVFTSAKNAIAKNAYTDIADVKNAGGKASAKNKNLFPDEIISIAKNATEDCASENNAIEKFANERIAKAEAAIAASALANGALKKADAKGVVAANISLAGFAVAKNAVEDVDAAKDADAMSAIAKFVREKAAGEKIAVENTAAKEHAMEELAVEGFAMEKSASAEVATEETTLGSPKDETKNEQKINRLEKGQEELGSQEQKKRQRHSGKVTATKIAYRQAQAIIYIYLWRRIVGSGISKISLSMQVLSDAVGISKRTAQDAIKKLNELKLLKSEREGETGVSQHQIFKPWEKTK
jgi:hypothetical protein